MAYPERPRLSLLPEFAGTNTVRPTAEQRAMLREFVATQYQAGRSLRELAELTGRTQTAVRRALDQEGIARRGVGAPPQPAPLAATQSPSLSVAPNWACLVPAREGGSRGH